MSAHAKMCMRSWQKFYPELEIVRWDEENFDVNISNFSKEAYLAKKWAFVSDVTRVYVLEKYGGLYLDTDMEIIRRDDSLFGHDLFVGRESPQYVAVGVMGVKEPGHPLMKDLMTVYKDLQFSMDRAFEFAIPVLITSVLKKYGLCNENVSAQHLQHGIYIYPQDFFYPMSFDKEVYTFTENTCMIHHYKGSWMRKRDLIRIRMIRLIGRKNMDVLSKLVRRYKAMQIIKKVKRAIIPVRLSMVVKSHLQLGMKKIAAEISRFEDSHYMVVHHPEWFGVSNATRELFDNTISIPEVFSRRNAHRIASLFLQKPFKIYIFSGLAYGWEYIVEALKEADASVVVKVIWHGGNSLNVEKYDWNRFQKMFDLHNKGLVDAICFVKKSMADLYASKGYRAVHLMNNVHSVKPNSSAADRHNHEGRYVRIGLYVSGDRWVKNMFNQLAAISLIPGVVVDCVPLSQATVGFAGILNMTIEGVWQSLSREELLARMSKNDVNLYATFSECAPLIPIESFELGVPCVTGNNHHYWDDSALKQLVVVNDVDNPYTIYQKIVECLENKEDVMKMYRIWKKQYDIEASKSLCEFLSI